MERVVIVGGRIDGHAKVVLELTKSVKNIQVIGFLDDNTQNHGKLIHDVVILGSTDLLENLVESGKVDAFIVAIGDNRTRRELGEKLRLICKTVNIIHPSAVIDPSVRIGQGNVIMQNSVIVADALIGDFVNIHALVSVDHDSVIHSGSNLAPGVHIAGRVQIGKDTFIGTGASIIPDISIGTGSIIGAGSVVIRNLPNFVKAVGNPARILEKILNY